MRERIDVVLADYGEVAAIIGVWHEMVKQLRQIGAPADEVKYISYFVDAQKFPSANVANSPPHFLGIGRFVETKAHSFTQLAFAQALQQVPEAKLTIVGEKALRTPA